MYNFIRSPEKKGTDNSKDTRVAGCWWFMSIILATQEAEIRRIAV
jgi:hypothetical protein